VITLWDVLEHLEDPPAHLRAARRLLKPDGILVIETQNVASFFARLLGRKWQHYKHAEHLYHFDPRTLQRLLSEAASRSSRTPRAWAASTSSMAFLVERVGRIHPWLSTLASPLRLLGSRALYVNLCDEMVVVARAR
jgi:2-polyprenyl-3-methyl-5-hydroxy-6-metoxy-1,4-benzoquinol methylase